MSKIQQMYYVFDFITQNTEDQYARCTFCDASIFLFSSDTNISANVILANLSSSHAKLYNHKTYRTGACIIKICEPTASHISYIIPHRPAI